MYQYLHCPALCGEWDPPQLGSAPCPSSPAICTLKVHLFLGIWKHISLDLPRPQSELKNRSQNFPKHSHMRLDTSLLSCHSSPCERQREQVHRPRWSSSVSQSDLDMLKKYVLQEVVFVSRKRCPFPGCRCAESWLGQRVNTAPPQPLWLSMAPMPQRSRGQAAVGAPVLTTPPCLVFLPDAVKHLQRVSGSGGTSLRKRAAVSPDCYHLSAGTQLLLLERAYLLCAEGYLQGSEPRHHPVSAK